MHSLGIGLGDRRGVVFFLTRAVEIFVEKSHRDSELDRALEPLYIFLRRAGADVSDDDVCRFLSGVRSA